MLTALGGGEGLGYLLGGAGSLLGALGGFNQKKSDNGWLNVANVWAADRAFDQQVALMKHQAEINSPANQMKRYKEAGLNPNLIYGQISSGNVSMPSGVNAPIIRDYNRSDRKYSKLDAFSGVLKSISDAMDNLNTAKAQKDYLDAKTQTEKAKANKLNSQADLKNTKNIIDGVASKTWKNDEQKKEYDFLSSRNSSLLNQIDSIKSNIQKWRSSGNKDFSNIVFSNEKKLNSLENEYNNNLKRLRKIVYNLRDSEVISFKVPFVGSYNYKSSY